MFISLIRFLIILRYWRESLTWGITFFLMVTLFGQVHGKLGALRALDSVALGILWLLSFPLTALVLAASRLSFVRTWADSPLRLSSLTALWAVAWWGYPAWYAYGAESVVRLLLRIGQREQAAALAKYFNHPHVFTILPDPEFFLVPAVLCALRAGWVLVHSPRPRGAGGQLPGAPAPGHRVRRRLAMAAFPLAVLAAVGGAGRAWEFATGSEHARALAVAEQRVYEADEALKRIVRQYPKQLWERKLDKTNPDGYVVTLTAEVERLEAKRKQAFEKLYQAKVLREQAKETFDPVSTAVAIVGVIGALLAWTELKRSQSQSSGGIRWESPRPTPAWTAWTPPAEPGPPAHHRGIIFEPRESQRPRFRSPGSDSSDVLVQHEAAKTDEDLRDGLQGL